ncbi:30S ribosomal protein S1, partial [bacterium]|nr:30S ribosomal protein S1 [bacterium]
MTDTVEQPESQDGDRKPGDGGSEVATIESPDEAVSPESASAPKADEPEVYLSLDELDDDNEYSQEEFNQMLDLYDQTMVDFVEGELVVGKILAVNDKEVSVDIGFKSEGVIPIEEFKTPSEINIGDDIEVFLDDVEDSDGQLVLSKRKADFMRQWEKVVKAYENDETLEGVCMRRIRGGIVVDLFGVDAFLPGSQIDVKPIRDFDALIGKTMEFKIVKVNELRKNIVVSHRVLIEEGMKEQRQQILENLEKGQILEGSVKNITDFGVFIDLGGVDGLLHINDLSWGRVSHPSEIVSLDEKIKIQILDFNEEKDRISLGYKQLQPHPWDNIKDKYTEGDVITGKVVNIADYGAFIELEKGVEGLIHISEMSWTQHIKHPSKIVSLGETVEAKILSLDHEGRKISLGLKQLEPDPWEDIEEKYPVNSKQSGIVRNLTNFGAFVELEEGIDGLIHISDLSWTKKIRHPGEVVKKGDEVEIMVLNIDKGNRRISLGFKQIQDNPWDRFAEVYSPQKITKANIVRMIEKGVIVELPDSVDGFVPMSQLQKQGIRRPSDGYKVGDELELMVIEFNKESKKIILSEKSAHDKSVSEAGLAVDDHEAIAEFEKEAGIDKKKAATSGGEAKEATAKKSETGPAAEEPLAEQPKAAEAQSGAAEGDEKGESPAKLETTEDAEPVVKAEVTTSEEAEAVEAQSVEANVAVEEPTPKEEEEAATAEA